jgi:hypothetical protein
VLQKRALETSGRKTEKVRGGWRILHGSHGLCCSACIINMVKQRRLCCAGHVARAEEMRNVWKHSFKKRDGDLGVKGSGGLTNPQNTKQQPQNSSAKRVT